MVAEKLPLKALYLYGSYSKGNYRADSDIDIAVIVERLDDDYFKDTPLLWKLRRKISNLDVYKRQGWYCRNFHVL